MGDADEIKKTNFTNFTKDYKFYLGETKICENEEIWNLDLLLTVKCKALASSERNTMGHGVKTRSFQSDEKLPQSLDTVGEE